MHTQIPWTKQGVYFAVLQGTLPIRQLIVSKVGQFGSSRVWKHRVRSPSFRTTNAYDGLEYSLLLAKSVATPTTRCINILQSATRTTRQNAGWKRRQGRPPNSVLITPAAVFLIHASYPCSPDSVDIAKVITNSFSRSLAISKTRVHTCVNFFRPLLCQND